MFHELTDVLSTGEFIEDLRVLLTKEQEARWPLVERELSRLKKMADGRIAGEKGDVVRMVAELPEASGEPRTALREGAGYDHADS